MGAMSHGLNTSTEHPMNAFEQQLGYVLGLLQVSFVPSAIRSPSVSTDVLGTIRTNLLARWMWRLGLTQLHTAEDASELVYRTLLLDGSPDAIDHLGSYDVFMVIRFQSLPVVLSLTDLVSRMGMRIGLDGEIAMDRTSFDGGLSRMMEFDLWVGALALKHGINIRFPRGPEDDATTSDEFTDKEADRLSALLLERERIAEIAYQHTQLFFQRLEHP